jgi:hypothetical protein
MERSHERDGSCCNFADRCRVRVRADSKSEYAEVNKGDALAAARARRSISYGSSAKRRGLTFAYTTRGWTRQTVGPVDAVVLHAVGAVSR